MALATLAAAVVLVGCVERAEPPVRTEPADWRGPPEREIGAVADLGPVIAAQHEGMSVAVTRVTVYETGALLHLAVRADPEASEWFSSPENTLRGLGPAPEVSEEEGAELPEDMLRVQVAYGDGRRAGTVDEALDGPVSAVEEPDGPVLTNQRGGGGGHAGEWIAWDHDVWLWPLPEPGTGPVEVIVDWPVHGIEGARAELDADAIAAAADRAAEPWEDEPGTASTSAVGAARASERRPRPWEEPPDHELGAPVAFDSVRVDGNDAVVALTGATVHRTGVELHFDTVVRPDEADELREARGYPAEVDRDERWHPDVLTVGVTGPEAGEAADVSGLGGPPPETEPDEPGLVYHGGLRDGPAWDDTFWLWPRPDGDGALEVAVWPGPRRASSAPRCSWTWPSSPAPPSASCGCQPSAKLTTRPDDEAVPRPDRVRRRSTRPAPSVRLNGDAAGGGPL